MPAELMKKTDQVVVNHPARFDAEALIAKGIEQGLPVESLERLLAMRAQLKAEQAREAFFAALSAFQASVPAIPKNRSAGGRYKYADLADICKVIGPHLQEHGLSYRFDTEFTDNPPSQIVTCTVQHINGHSETSKFRSPIDAAARMNEIQKSGSSQTYGKRYSLANALGLVVDDDDDGHGTRPPNPPANTQTEARDPPISEDQHKRLEAIIARLGLNREWVREWLTVHTGEESPHLDGRSITQGLYTRLDRAMEDWAALETEIARRNLDRARVIAWVEKATKGQCHHLADLGESARDKLFDKLDEWAPVKPETEGEDDGIPF